MINTPSIKSLLDLSLSDLTELLNGPQQNSSYGGGTFGGKRATVPRTAVARYPFIYAGIGTISSVSPAHGSVLVGPFSDDISFFSDPNKAPYLLCYVDVMMQATGITAGYPDAIQCTFRVGDTPSQVSALWFKRFYANAKATLADSPQVFLREGFIGPLLFQSCDITGPIATATLTGELTVNLIGIKIDWR